MTAAAFATIELGGFKARGAESLAVRAGGLVFTGALDARALDELGTDGAGEVTAAADAIGRVLAAAGCGSDQVGKAKLFRTAMEATAVSLAALGHSFPRAATVMVGAGLPDPCAAVALECVGLASGRPEPFRDEAGQIVASRLGDLLFTAGCGPFAREDLVGAGDLDRQGRAALHNLCRALALAGLAPADLLKVNNTAACWHDYRLYNAGYDAVLTGTNAARCSVGGALRHPLSLVEVEGIASFGSAARFVDSTRSGAGRTRFVPRSDTVYRPDLGPCKGPHSHGARAGNVVFVAGECPYDAEDRLIGTGDVAAQTLRTMENVRLSLEALGARLDDVVKTSVTLSDARLRPAFEAAYASIFRPPYPARSLVATPLGQYGILVEIEAIAVVGADRDRVAVVAEGAA